MERKFLFPLYEGRVVRRFQATTIAPITSVKTVHNDIKILGKTYNRRIMSIADGRVISTGYNDEGNNALTIEHADGLKSYLTFARLEIFVKVGQLVRKGDVLAHYTSDGHQHTLLLRIAKK